MASYVLTHGFAHRMTAMGVLQSTPVIVEGDGIAVDEKAWTHRLPETMDLSGGDITMIEDMLIRLTQTFQEGMERLPKSTAKADNTRTPETVL